MNKYRYKVSLRIRHPTIDSSVVISKLGMTPHRSWNVGEQRSNPNGDLLDGLNDETYCTFALENNDSLSLVECIRSHLNYLNEVKYFFNEIYSTGGSSEYFIGVFHDNNCGEVFDADMICRLAEFKIGLSFDIYVDDV